MTLTHYFEPPLNDAEREARDPLVRRQKELQEQREQEEQRKARASRLDTLPAAAWPAFDQRIQEHIAEHDETLKEAIAETLVIYTQDVAKGCAPKSPRCAANSQL